MRIFNYIKKELIINRLVTTYNHHYQCDDWKSIEVLRNNYSKDELKSILKSYKDMEKRGIHPFQRNIFKENIELSKEYHENGNLYSEGNYRNGEKDGLWKIYDENGKIEYEYNYINGEWNGLCKNYYKNGSIKTEGNYINGERDGLFKNYYENGSIQSQGNYKLREKYQGINQKKNNPLYNPYLKYSETTGLWKFYDENGKLSSEINYKNGVKHGLSKQYYENGQLELETEYSNQKIISQKSWDKDGNEIKRED